VYFSGVVAPAVTSSVAELSSASSALLSLIRAVEDSITVVLRKCVDAFMAEVRAGAAAAAAAAVVYGRGMHISVLASTALCWACWALLCMCVNL
jgi:hypothetical protein